jgi:hypothetical protein
MAVPNRLFISLPGLSREQWNAAQKKKTGKLPVMNNRLEKSLVINNSRGAVRVFPQPHQFKGLFLLFTRNAAEHSPENVAY